MRAEQLASTNPEENSIDPAEKRSVRVRRADLHNPQDQQAIIDLLNTYATNLIGRMAPLPSHVIEGLIPGLQAHPTSFVFLADTASSVGTESRAIGIATCFVGFSTFRARRLINIHDIAVRPEYQNRGIGGMLIDAVCDYARQLECCAVTLEVQANNPARRLYATKGFRDLSMPVHDQTILYAKLELTPPNSSMLDQGER